MECLMQPLTKHRLMMRQLSKHPRLYLTLHQTHMCAPLLAVFPQRPLLLILEPLAFQLLEPLRSST